MMKKYTFTIISLTFAVALMAQHNNKRSAELMPYGEVELTPRKANLDYVAATPTKGENDKTASTIMIGTSSNIHSTIRDRQNQVVYNPDVNTVIFGHRQNNGGPGNTGIMSFDYSTDGGANWTINPFQTTPTLDGGAGNNYPSVGLYNPVANTDPANAFMVQTGTKASFDKSFRASAKLDGTLTDETYITNSQIGPGPSNNEHGGYGLYVTSLGEAWYASSNWNLTGDVSLHLTGSYHDFFISKGVFNVGSNNYDWVTTDTITPEWHSTLATAGYMLNLATSPNMAWSVNGMTGYLVTMGADSNASNNTMWRPYIMKTIDGGATWTKYADYDFSTNAVMQTYIWGLNTNPIEKRPFFGDFDVVVDNNNELRIICEVHSGFSNHPDSLNYYFAGVQSKFIMEVVTNTGSGNYDVTFIDSLRVEDFTWDLSASARQHLLRPQAARSQDGSKIFYSWISSDPTLSISREYPEISAIGTEVATNNWTPITNLSTGNASQYASAYQTMSVDVIENGTEKAWELPIVYVTGIGGAGLSNADTPGQYYFLRGVGFDQADFNPIGIEQEIPSINEVLVYPNPTKNVVTIEVNGAVDFNFTVTDVLGKIISSKSIDGNRTTIDFSNNKKGIYFIEIISGKSKVTKKIIVTD